MHRLPGLDRPYGCAVSVAVIKWKVSDIALDWLTTYCCRYLQAHLLQFLNEEQCWRTRSVFLALRSYQLPGINTYAFVWNCMDMVCDFHLKPRLDSATYHPTFCPAIFQMLTGYATWMGKQRNFSANIAKQQKCWAQHATFLTSGRFQKWKCCLDQQVGKTSQHFSQYREQ